MTLQLTGEGVLCVVAGLGSADCGGKGVIGQYLGSSGSECSNRRSLDRDVAYLVGFEIFIYDLCIIPFLGTDNRVDGHSAFDIRGAAEGVRVDDVLHEGIKGGDVCNGDGEVPHCTLGVCGLDKVSHVGTSCQPVPGVRLTYRTITLRGINVT